MIRVHIFYPPSPRFDMAYYCERHMPMVKARLGDACTGYTIDAGLAGGAAGAPPTYAAVGALLLTSVEALQAGLAQHGAEIMGDVANYTDAQPILQISEILVG
ncbi:MAG: EthD family reductase [Microbacteriaceae bacterium]|nr:EthD family reductase [Burkholderiaceae bacterium]